MDYNRLYYYWYFNPHSHKGSDHIFNTIPILMNYFNPHSHKGSDVSSIVLFGKAMYFNPHSHKGSDLELCPKIDVRGISIHTPTRGVTDMAKAFGLKEKISIHTPTRGVTTTCPPFSFVISISIHTPTRGVTKGGYRYE